MYLLDTNHCSRIIQGDPAVLNRLRQVGNVPLATCAIVRGELIYMAYKSQQQIANLTRIQAFLQHLHVYPVDDITADIYGQFKAEILQYFGPHERRKRNKIKIENLGISENDLWIVATALQNGFTVVSADTDFERMQAVRSFPLESWIE